MRLLRLALENFRIYRRMDETIPQGVVIIVGGNAQGKTALLEAVYYLATFASFQTRHDSELINFQESRHGSPAVGRLVAEFQRDGEARTHRLEVRLIWETNGAGKRLRREVLLDGMKRKLGEVVGVFNAVLFLPQMTAIVSGSPEIRRRYLNLTLSQVDREYAATLTSYGQVLSQRNALLKRLQEQGGDPSQLDFWDSELSALGAVLIHRRVRLLKELGRLARRFHWELTHNSETLELRYQPAYDPLNDGTLFKRVPGDYARFSVEELAAGMAEALRRRRAEEIARGVTTVGPHRDEFRFWVGDMDLGTYGSRGQIRTALLSLKFAEVEWIESKTKQVPVLLLDETLAELDAARRADIQSRLAKADQVLLTTTDLGFFSPDFVHRSTVWHITAGTIER